MAYNENFITAKPVSLSKISPGKKNEIALLLNGNGPVIDYLGNSAERQHPV